MVGPLSTWGLQLVALQRKEGWRSLVAQGVKIQCHHCCGTGLILGPGTSACCRCSKKKKREREREREREGSDSCCQQSRAGFLKEGKLEDFLRTRRTGQATTRPCGFRALVSTSHHRWFHTEWNGEGGPSRTFSDPPGWAGCPLVFLQRCPFPSMLVYI